MQGFHISRIAVNPHHEMYRDLIAALGGGLAELGHPWTTGVNTLVSGAVNILVGSTIFAARHYRLAEQLRGRPYVVYQLEQLDCAAGLLREWPEYLDLLRDAAWIWDYSPAGAEFLRREGFRRVSHLPPAHHPALESFRPRPIPGLDVAFCGSPSPRRARLLEALAAAGIRGAHSSGLYGEERDRLLAGARIALNLHAWDGLRQLETVRLSHLLANHCFVISETADHNPYGDGVVYADYDELVPACQSWLSRPEEERRRVAERGYAQLRRRSMADELRRVLAE